MDTQRLASVIPAGSFPVREKIFGLVAGINCANFLLRETLFHLDKVFHI